MPETADQIVHRALMDALNARAQEKTAAHQKLGMAHTASTAADQHAAAAHRELTTAVRHADATHQHPLPAAKQAEAQAAVHKATLGYGAAVAKQHQAHAQEATAAQKAQAADFAYSKAYAELHQAQPGHTPADAPAHPGHPPTQQGHNPAPDHSWYPGQTQHPGPAAPPTTIPHFGLPPAAAPGHPVHGQQLHGFATSDHPALASQSPGTQSHAFADQGFAAFKAAKEATVTHDHHHSGQTGEHPAAAARSDHGSLAPPSASDKYYDGTLHKGAADHSHTTAATAAHQDVHSHAATSAASAATTIHHP